MSERVGHQDQENDTAQEEWETERELLRQWTLGSVAALNEFGDVSKKPCSELKKRKILLQSLKPEI